MSSHNAQIEPGWTTDPRNFTYNATIGLTGFLLRLFRARIEGAEHVPKEGPCIVVCNHRSNFDPPILSHCVGHRTIFFMAKQELFQNRLLGSYISALHAFPVDRSKPDRKAIRTALGLLREGRIVGVFPEGTRGQTQELGPFQEGFASLARLSGTPILPACQIGGAWWTGRLSIRFAPLIPSKGVKSKILVEQVRESMQSLMAR